MDFKSKRIKFTLVIFIVIIAGIIWIASSRPDIGVGMQTIANASKYPQDDWRVELAADYLIWTEHPDTYELLGYYLTACSMVNNVEDYRAEQSANILGMYQGDQSMESLLAVFWHDYGIEGRPGCTGYVLAGLKLKGDEGYEEIEAIAKGIYPDDMGWRAAALSILGRTKDPKYIDLLTEAAFMYGDLSQISSLNYIHIRMAAIRALVEIGTNAAYQTIEKISVEDPYGDVRVFALESLNNKTE